VSHSCRIAVAPSHVLCFSVSQIVRQAAVDETANSVAKHWSEIHSAKADQLKRDAAVREIVVCTKQVQQMKVCPWCMSYRYM
jgi:hypothetical protein